MKGCGKSAPPGRRRSGARQTPCGARPNRGARYGPPVPLSREAASASPGRSLEAGGNAGSRGMTAPGFGREQDSAYRDLRPFYRANTPMRVESPPPVLPGARVGVAALSGRIDPSAARARGRRARRPRFRAGARAQPRVRAPDSSRGRTTSASRPSTSSPRTRGLAAIFFARGGHGALRLLPGIDWDLLARRPRAYVGYSDLTPFLLQVVERLGLVAFHGPMVATDLARGLGAEERDTLLARAGRGRRLSTCPVEGGDGWRGSDVAEGPLLGGCLSPAHGDPGHAVRARSRRRDPLLGGRQRAALPARPNVDPPAAVR